MSYVLQDKFYLIDRVLYRLINFNIVLIISQICCLTGTVLDPRFKLSSWVETSNLNRGQLISSMKMEIASFSRSFRAESHTKIRKQEQNQPNKKQRIVPLLFSTVIKNGLHLVALMRSLKN